MDVEDVLGDQIKLLEMLKDLTFFCEIKEIPCDLYISGIKLQLLQDLDLKFIEQLNTMDFVKVGYHGNTHSYLPVVTLTDGDNTQNNLALVENSRFNIEERKLVNEIGGLSLFKKFFNSRIYRSPGLCWSPMYFEFMKNNGFDLTSIDIDFDKSFSCYGITFLPVEEKPLESFTSAEDVVKSIQGKTEVSLYLHPAKLLYNQFWDKSDQRNIWPDYDSRINRIKELFLYFKDEFHLFNIDSLDVKKSDYVDLRRVFMQSMLSKWRWSQLPRNYFNERHVVECIKFANNGFFC